MADTLTPTPAEIAEYEKITSQAASKRFDTVLSPTEENQFQQWKTQYAPKDSGEDYDLRGAFKSGFTPNASGHWPDTFKKPNHPTFSTESIYARGSEAALAGHWEGETFIPPGEREINPIKDLSSDDLFDLSTKDENFDLVNEFRKNKNLWADQSLVQKVADVHDRIKQRGFQVSDIPGPGKILKTGFDIAKGFGKQAWNYASALIGVPLASIAGEITGQGSGFQTELAQQGQRQVLENVAGTEEAVTGLANMAERGAGKLIKAAAAFGGAETPPATPEQKVNDLWKSVGTGEAQEEIARGKGGFLEPVGGEVRKELEAAGKPVRPEEVSALAAGDPLSFYTFGKAFQGAGKIIPPQVGRAVEAVAAKAEPLTEKAVGKTLQAAGSLADTGARAVKFAAPAIGAVGGLIKGGPIGALAGERIGQITRRVAGKVSEAGKATVQAGKEIAGEAPVTTATTQLAKDLAGGIPTAATEIGKGAAFDIGTAAATSESPQDTRSVGVGAFFGGLGAGKRIGQRVISGQIIGPRPWGSETYVPPSGKMDPKFETMNLEAVKAQPPAVQARLNAIREFLKGASADTDIFLIPKENSEQALVNLGFTSEQAKTFADQEGFFTANLPGKDGTPRRVILAKNIDAAPHEAFHAIQDVLGEDANQAIDQIVKQEYGPQWESEGQRYADRIQPGGDWRETILDTTGTGMNYAKEKVAMNVANEYRAATGAEPTSEYVRARAKEVFGQLMDRAVQANPNIDPNQIASRVWRDVLSPQEASAIADSYLARELAAENFDAVFKHGPTTGLTQRLARIVANLVSTLGGEPLSPERVSQIGEIAPKFRVAEAVRAAPELITPKQANEPLPPVTAPAPPINKAADEAGKIASQAPSNPTVAGNASPREILGTIATAIADQRGVKLNYLSAPDEPAAAISSNRDVRRALIEAFRTMPPEARALWEKNFFPERVLKLKGDKYQVLGWSPEVFAANAHKLAAKLTELGVAASSPYPIAENTFTPEGWKSLYEDTQKFVQNQISGRTGAGGELVVPKTAKGMYAPPVKGQPIPLEQDRADFISMLFGIPLPGSARIQKGRLPLNIAGQEVSAATQPGRVEVPVIPRGEFTGAEAKAQGIEGRKIMEVNPLRSRLEQAAQEKGIAMPEFIEAQQRLNLENIKEVQVSPEQPQFRGNTLTLAAGFQPSSAPRAVKAAAVRDENGKVWEGIWHGVAEENARRVGAKGPFTDGFTTNNGEFLNRADALERAKEVGQVAQETKPGLADEQGAGLENSQLMFGRGEAAKFQPSAAPKSAEESENLVKRVAAMTPKEFDEWAHSTPGGLTEAAYQTGLNAPTQGFVNLLKAADQSFGKRAIEAIDAQNWDAATALTSQQQFFNEAWQAATGEGSAGYSLRKEKPGYQPKFPLDKSAQTEETAVAMQPKSKDFELKPAKQGFSKAWILPNGKPVQLGGQWHHDFINENGALRKLYDLPEGETGEENRISALQKGFVRINYTQNQGRLTVEARTADWPKQKNAVRDFVEANAGKIDHIQVTLMDRPVEDVQHSEDVPVFKLDDNEKAAMTPFMDLGEARKMTSASEKLFNKAQLQPTPDEEAAGKRVDERLRQRARGGRAFFASARVTPLDTELKKVQTGESFGQTFTYDGDVWSPEANKPVDIVTLASTTLPKTELNREKFNATIEPYKELLQNPDVVAGVFSLDKDNASVDINAVVSQDHRKNTKEFANANDQISIWDAAKREEVKTGGSGNTVLKTIPQMQAALEKLQAGEPVDVKGISAQFQPKNLFGVEDAKRFPTKREISEMTPKELGEFYPEIVIPKTNNEPIASDIKSSPLFKKAIDEPAAVKLFGDKLSGFARENIDNPLFKAGRSWYSEFTPQLKKEFGPDVDLFAELLAATSPQTSVASNFGFAVDAIESFRKGRFTKIMTKFNQGLDMMANDTWKAWYNRELNAGNIPDPPIKPTPASFMEAWINKHDLKPRQTNGSLYGTHSLPVLQVFARQWLNKSRGPKTLNFVENLLGTSDEATIDLWADRTMRRLGYEGEPRWRILPKNIAPVSDADFEFSQKSFRYAAQQLGMRPADLQAALWFTEKGLWDSKGWSKLDLGDFREQMKRLPALRADIKERLQPKPKQSKLRL